MKLMHIMSGMVFAVLAITASCATTSDDDRDDSAGPASEEVSAPQSKAEAAQPDAFESFQATPDVTCKAKKGVCTSAKLCQGSGQHVLNATGCPAGDVCCS